MRQRGLFGADLAARFGPFDFGSSRDRRAGVTAGGGEGRGRGRGRGRGTAFRSCCFSDGIQFEIQRCARCERANNNDKYTIHNMGIENRYCNSDDRGRADLPEPRRGLEKVFTISPSSDLRVAINLCLKLGDSLMVARSPLITK